MMIVRKRSFAVNNLDAGRRELIIILFPQHCGQAAFFLDRLAEMLLAGRVIAALTFDRQGRKIIPHAQYMAGNEMVIAFDDIPRRIDDGSILATDVQFAEVALAIARKQSQRAASRANQQRLG